MTQEEFVDWKNRMKLHIEHLEVLIGEMPYRGDKCQDSIKICLLDAIGNLEAHLSVTILKDFEPKKN